MAERFGVLPTDVLNLNFDDYLLNLKALNVLARFEAKQYKKARRKMK
jgi:hypothetical protein